jgi:hypothetical protein
MDPIAVRELEAHAADGSVRPIIVRFGRPEPDPLPGGDWRCPFQIAGTRNGGVQFAFGVDAVQALQLAFVAVGVLLFAADGPRQRITWLDTADLGFPEPTTS